MIIENKNLTMSHVEIAELVGSRPDSVKRTIETLAEKGIITFTQTVEKSSGGRPGTIYHVNKRNSYVVVAQLCPEFTARLVDRWQELEEQATHPALPSTYIEALEELLTSKKNEEALTLVNKEQEAEINDLKNLFKEGMTTTQFCKMLNGVNTQQINSYLAERNWLFNESKSGTRWRCASYARDKYLTEHQHKISVHGGEDFIKFQPVLLRKGAERIFTLYRQAKLPMKANWDGQFTHDKQIQVAS
ncbi:Rha family transcriptional regulator [Limnobaculum xujianqingii]|uniref:Rha family transcriptional regulator n=1 Tax=Limnobaculum xujianqingii TaxID=2738837 RepID=UPI001E481C6F|nr:Rha family transcriptional regulator [Limnobaculum xujianqingii]